MGQLFSALKERHIEFIEQQHIYFVATAPKEGRINLSPKGLDSLRVLNNNRILWLNLTGSGNETAAHLLEDHRMTLMFCSFEEKPLILRAYGTASTIHPDEPSWDDLYSNFSQGNGARQLIDLKVDLVHSSCGFGVPRMEFLGKRETLDEWIEKKGEKGIRQYWEEKNMISMDGKPTR
ncbi:MAG: pyridoxamine 5'-phosphate oxidase family protein [Gammaproteobacteria bacterium]|uniref:Pyridoxamine 5'-phosphate oxidase family protein n=1 Tax=Candidatus Thiopontia autotrophica TaxID=2841688 RepID=A0A8J6NY05_9GAMM|nr:pyridoxamine 5'-phosphate oxidase family protein [Candidatus Thiopontia autotrophica]MBL6969293.1 pyridoxamine 5'-phosphate oxidase family protein [Gammaproteobacteria bacterium]